MNKHILTSTGVAEVQGGLSGAEEGLSNIHTVQYVMVKKKMTIKERKEIEEITEESKM